MLYNFCGLNIFYEPRYERTILRSEKYIAKDQTLKPDITMEVSEERIDNYLEVYPYISRSLAEYVIYGAEFYQKVIEFDAMLLHSSAICVDNKAYLFTADSGTGKSTHTELWMKHFGDRAVMINDDKPVIRLIDNKVYACGTPFSGKHDINKNIIVPLQGICSLNRGTENRIEKISTHDALIAIMNQTLTVPELELKMKFFDTLDKVLKTVCTYRLYCDISDEAVVVAYNGMK